MRCFQMTSMARCFRTIRERRRCDMGLQQLCDASRTALRSRVLVWKSFEDYILLGCFKELDLES